MVSLVLGGCANQDTTQVQIEATPIPTEAPPTISGFKVISITIARHFLGWYKQGGLLMSNNNRINPYMGLHEVISIMSEGNPGALECISMMFADNAYGTAIDLLLFDKLEIYGSKLYMVWNDCCNRDMKKFKETIRAFRSEKFTKEQIHENLNQIRAKPFIEETT